MKRIFLALGLLVSATSLAASTSPALLCRGYAPAFTMTAQDALLTLNVPRLATYAVSPSLTGTEAGFWRATLLADQQDWDVAFETRACAVRGQQMDLAVELAVPTASGLRVMQGCCTWVGG